MMDTEKRPLGLRVAATAALTAALMVTALRPASVRAAEPEGKPARRPPNVVLILADDLGWTDLGCMGSKYYETPHIDRLAKEGMKLTSGYTCGPNCAPTRAALMSGQYGPRTGVFTVNNLDRGPESARKLIPPRNNTKLPQEKVTVAGALKAAGYATALFGKWHLGDDGAHHPARRGFDRAIVARGSHFQFPTSPPVKVDPKTYLADFLTDQAVGFIEQNKDRPFFLYLPHFAVHEPLQAKPELIAKYKKKPTAGGHGNPVYAAMIESLDQSVGRILAKLGELGLAGNTVVIFSSDNGGVAGKSAESVGGKDNTSNLPLRGGKGMLYEGGVRVPLLVRWPGVVRPGAVCDEPVNSVDFYPTLLELAGAKPDPKYTLDGVSLAPLLKSGGSAGPRREGIFWHFPGYLQAGGGGWRTKPVGSVRVGDYKLLEFFEDGRLELYNLKDDIGEKNNLAAKMPDKARQLRAKLIAWRESVGAPMLRANPNYDPSQPAQEARKKGKARGGDEGRKE